MFYVYALFSPSSGKIYIGQTEDLNKRINEHNGVTDLKQWTHKYKPWEVFYDEKCATRSRAMQREKQLKSGAGRDYLKSVLKEYLEGGKNI